MRIGEAAVIIAIFSASAFGIALAKGFWITVIAAFFPPFAWVLVAKWIIERVA